MRSTSKQKNEELQKEMHNKEAGEEEKDSSMSQRIDRQHTQDRGDESLDWNIHGNPNLIYASKFVEGWEPSGVPVRVILSVCF